MPFTPIPTSALVPPPASVRADFAVQLIGSHATSAVAMARSVLLVMPSARIRITHPEPALSAYTAWCDALNASHQVFNGTEPLARIAEPEAEVAGHLTFSGPVQDVSVDALTATHSVSGAAQIRVRVGGLLVIAADRDAVISQCSLWTTAYRHAAGVWPGLPRLEEMTEAPHWALPTAVAA